MKLLITCLLLLLLINLPGCGNTYYKEDAVGGTSQGPPPVSISQSTSRSYITPPAPEMQTDTAMAMEPPQIAPEEEGMKKEKFNQERYQEVEPNRFISVKKQPLSTFSIDVDTAAYSNLRRFLNNNQQLPPASAIRIEEMINYFNYDYAPASEEEAFSINTELGPCPWDTSHHLLHIGLQGNRMIGQEIPPCNLVFLVDVSGSMEDENKLPLLKTALGLLVEKLRPQDSVALVVYAGAAGLVLPPTSGENKQQILNALSRLQAGGSTDGGQGIELAYKVAEENFRPGINRVILATDGDFNVGTTGDGPMVKLIEEKRKSGIFLTVLGLGMWNLNDSMMEKLADKGNGNYAYIDTLSEAQKVLVDEMTSTLVPIAKDVKLQIEFNPLHVESYRLIGYENRLLADEDFLDDTKDAGEIGAGHSVTAIYELVPTSNPNSGDIPLKYQKERDLQEAAFSEELVTVKIRYKKPDEDTSRPLSRIVKNRVLSPAETSDNFRFSAAVAAFGMLLRDSPYKGKATFEMVREFAQNARGEDPFGYRQEFIRLVDIAKTLKKMEK